MGRRVVVYCGVVAVVVIVVVVGGGGCCGGLAILTFRGMCRRTSSCSRKVRGHRA